MFIVHHHGTLSSTLANAFCLVRTAIIPTIMYGIVDAPFLIIISLNGLAVRQNDGDTRTTIVFPNFSNFVDLAIENLILFSMTRQTKH